MLQLFNNLLLLFLKSFSYFRQYISHLWQFFTLFLSLMYSLASSLMYSLAYSLMHSLASSLMYSLAYSLNNLIISYLLEITHYPRMTLYFVHRWPQLRISFQQ
jgi:hypothetical protein